MVASEPLKPVDHKTTSFQTRSFSIDTPVDAGALAQALSAADLGLVRAKGFVETASNGKKAIQVVGRRWAVSEAPDTATLGLVVIGHGADFDEARIQRTISGFAH